MISDAPPPDGSLICALSSIILSFSFSVFCTFHLLPLASISRHQTCGISPNSLGESAMAFIYRGDIVPIAFTSLSSPVWGGPSSLPKKSRPLPAMCPRLTAHPGWSPGQLQRAFQRHNTRQGTIPCASLVSISSQLRQQAVGIEYLLSLGRLFGSFSKCCHLPYAGWHDALTFPFWILRCSQDTPLPPKF